MCRRFFFFLFLVAVFVAAGFIWFVHTGTPPHVFPDPKSIPQSEAHAAQNRLLAALNAGHRSAGLKTRTAARASASPPAPGQTITIHMSEDDINTTLATNPDIKKQMAARGIQAAQLAFAPPNLVTAYVKVRYHEQSEVAEVTGAMTAGDNGALQFTAQSVKVAEVPVPLQTAQKIIDKATTILLPKADSALPLTVQQVSVQGKEIYLTGPAKKRPED
ncbi:MAG TPA: LmeA family phospholipid-binding protein [Capsulimonadaceae bacterium]|nr:LmeA family phospholipid-binding protein [Capsulimonadaceae bacterium]